MKHQPKALGKFAATLIAVLAGLCSVDVLGQENSEKPADSIEIAEMEAALAAVQKQVDRERDRADAAEAKAGTLTLSLAEANRVREEQIEAHNELQLKMQAFGVDLLKVDDKSLEGRLLKSVRELDLVRQSNKKLEGEVTSLSEVLFHCLRAVPEADAATREMAEVALKRANGVLGIMAGPTILPARKVTDGKVVSIDPEVGLIVVNVGRNSGARIGMPIEVLQGGQPIGTAMVVDVRGGIFGAVLQDILVVGSNVKVGDLIRPRPNEASETI